MTYEHEAIVVTAMGLVILLATILAFACSILECGMKKTLKKFVAWMLFGALCSILAVFAIIILGKKHGMVIQVSRTTIMTTTAELSLALGAIFFWSETCKKANK